MPDRGPTCHHYSHQSGCWGVHEKMLGPATWHGMTAKPGYRTTALTGPQHQTSVVDRKWDRLIWHRWGLEIVRYGWTGDDKQDLFSNNRPRNYSLFTDPSSITIDWHYLDFKYCHILISHFLFRKHRLMDHRYTVPGKAWLSPSQQFLVWVGRKFYGKFMAIVSLWCGIPYSPWRFARLIHLSSSNSQSEHQLYGNTKARDIRRPCERCWESVQVNNK